jgi:hypothetical protein
VSTDNPSVTLTREQVLRLLDGNRVQLPTSLGMIELKSVPNPRWQKLHQVELSEDVKQQKWREESPDSVWHNDQYEMLVYGAGRRQHTPVHQALRPCAIRNWRHFQQMKNEIAGAEREGLELFPREGRLADNANQYHLWVMPAGMEVPIGWPDRASSSSATRRSRCTTTSRTLAARSRFSGALRSDGRWTMRAPRSRTQQIKEILS